MPNGTPTPQTPPVMDDERLARGAVVLFSYVYEDYFAPTVHRKFGRRQLAIWGTTLLLLPLAYWAVRASRAVSDDATLRAVTYLLFFMIVMTAYSYSRSQSEGRHRQQWEKSNRGRQYHMTVSTAGIVWQDQYTRLEERWPLYDHYQENEFGFWLYRAGYPDAPFLIPARAISREAAPILRELFRRHATQAKGFPVSMSQEASVVPAKSPPPAPENSTASPERPQDLPA